MPDKLLCRKEFIKRRPDCYPLEDLPPRSAISRVWFFDFRRVSHHPTDKMVLYAKLYRECSLWWRACFFLGGMCQASGCLCVIVSRKNLGTEPLNESSWFIFQTYCLYIDGLRPVWLCRRGLLKVSLNIIICLFFFPLYFFHNNSAGTLLVCLASS